MEVTTRILELLLAGATRSDLDAFAASSTGGTPEQQAAQAAQHRLVLRLHEQITRQRDREAELTALYETARDLTAIRDLDTILAAIVRRARQLLGADMTYLSLNDVADGASYMRVTDGAMTQEFRSLRLPLGTGLLGLVAQDGTPYFTEDYQADDRFVHQDWIDSAVGGEHIRAILGVPLVVEGTVIGALLAVHRRVRPFPPGEVALLSSFAAHAAVALENARLFAQARDAVAAADEAHATLLSRTRATERAAESHDRLTDVLLAGGGLPEVTEVLAEVLDGRLAVYDEEDRLVAGQPAAGDGRALGGDAARARASGRCVQAEDGAWVAVAAAGDERLGTLVLRTGIAMELAERRTFERGALVCALVLLFGRTEAEAESRVRGELLVDLVAGRDDLDPGRLRERARRQGADVDAPMALAVAQCDGEGDQASVRLMASLAREQHGLGAVQHGRAVLLAPGDPVDLGRLLAARVPGCTVGVAHAPGGVVAVAHAYREAVRTLEALLRLGRTGEVSDPAGLGLARLLLGGNGPHELAEFIEATLGPVLAYDRERDTQLVETLDAWFAAGGGLRETASRLHIHPNTVGQRLDRVGQLLGEGWRDPRRKLDVQLALQMERLRR